MRRGNASRKDDRVRGGMAAVYVGEDLASAETLEMGVC